MTEEKNHDSIQESDERQTVAENTEFQGDDSTQEANQSSAENGEHEVSEVDELKQEIESLKTDLLRERADFQNYRKHQTQKLIQMASDEAGKMLVSLLPVLDSFDQLLAAGSSEGDLGKFLEGAQLIRRQMFSVFSDKGVEEFDPSGQAFDPGSMEALSVQESDEVTEESVAQVFQKGYKLQGKVVRAARVVVSRPKPSKKEEN